MLILSLFPGADLLGMGFEQVGFCVVRGPDKVWGGDIRNFRPPAAKFDGVIGGPPCQPFSSAPRTKPEERQNYGYGLEMLKEFGRCVHQAQPLWYLMENVPGVPHLAIEGYTSQRLDLTASEFGLPQRRLRHIQFGSRDGTALHLERPTARPRVTEPAILASDTSRPWEDFLRLQGLPPDFDLPFTITEKRRAIGNGVPLPMARALANAVKNRPLAANVRLCSCGCGRSVTGSALQAGATCRKRNQKNREQAAANGGQLFTVHYP